MSSKNPPALRNSSSYKTWKVEIEIWNNLTDIRTDKRALAITFRLTWRARDAITQFGATHFNNENCIASVLAELDKKFEKDEVDLSYSSYSVFNNCTRPGETSMNDYIIEFEQKYNRAKQYKMELPDTVLAFKLLENPMLNDSSKKMASTAC